MDEEKTVLTGTVERVIYENETSGYIVFEVWTEDDDLVPVTGEFGHVSVGEGVQLQGRYVEHSRYGQQFKAEECQVSLPQTERAILAYLSSGALPHIGPATAKKLVKAYGAETLDVIADEPEKLTALRGISDEKAREISAAFRQMSGVREAILWMDRFGISASKASEAYKHFGGFMIERLSENPYLICCDPLNMRFSKADEMAAALAIDPESNIRVEAALDYAMRHNANNGHTCVRWGQLITAVTRFIRVEAPTVEKCLIGRVEDNELMSVEIEGDTYVYLPDMLYAEQDIAIRLAELAHYPAPQPRNLNRSIDALEIGQGFRYDTLQRQAIEMALQKNIMVLTGGPGTGKTTTLNAILALFESQADRVALCAPTGRAAKRLSELTGHKASTIHRLLEVDHSQGDSSTMHFLHNEKNLLKCDVVVLDEMSMVDVKLFQSLLSALKQGCRMVLVGDTDQLPSVGPGNILGEVIKSGVIPTVCLNHIFRQAHQSLIVENAHRIIAGEPLRSGGKEDDFFLLRSCGQAAQQLVCDLVFSRLPRSYGFDPIRDIQVLTPTKMGPIGTADLNPRLQQLLNPPHPGKNQLPTGGRIFREGDKVMQVKNDYDIPFERVGGEAGAGAFNGDMGIITEVLPDQGVVKVQMDDRIVTYSGDTLQELEIAYAITVHKSQGGEFPAVVLPVSDVSERLLYRNLLYTGVTRARQLCVMVGTLDIVDRMIHNVRQNMRYSGLSTMLISEAEKYLR